MIAPPESATATTFVTRGPGFTLPIPTPSGNQSLPSESTFSVPAAAILSRERELGRRSRGRDPDDRAAVHAVVGHVVRGEPEVTIGADRQRDRSAHTKDIEGYISEGRG